MVSRTIAYKIHSKWVRWSGPLFEYHFLIRQSEDPGVKLFLFNHIALSTLVKYVVAFMSCTGPRPMLAQAHRLNMCPSVCVYVLCIPGYGH